MLRYAEDCNGSVGDVAGVCNEARNVFGLMPHPEHAVDPLLGSGDGALLLAALVDAARERTFAARLTARCPPQSRSASSSPGCFASAARSRSRSRRPQGHRPASGDAVGGVREADEPFALAVSSSCTSDAKRLSPACCGSCSSSSSVAAPHGVAAVSLSSVVRSAHAEHATRPTCNERVTSFVPKPKRSFHRSHPHAESDLERRDLVRPRQRAGAHVQRDRRADLHFHLIHEPDGGRIGYQKICKKEEKPVPDDEIVKAFEIKKDKLVVLTDEDFEAVKTEGVKTIEISDFVPYEEIDPIYFDRTYFLGPQDGGEKVYALLREAMEQTGLAAIGKYVMRERQHLGCLRVRDGVITLEKMFFHDEIRPARRPRAGQAQGPEGRSSSWRRR